MVDVPTVVSIVFLAPLTAYAGSVWLSSDEDWNHRRQARRVCIPAGLLLVLNVALLFT